MFTYLINRAGNNTDPIKRALSARPGWTAVDSDDAKKDGNWSANFVWRPTWSANKPVPSGWLRGHANAAKRQSYNHLKAVEPLCTKDSLFDTVSREAHRSSAQNDANGIFSCRHASALRIVHAHVCLMNYAVVQMIAYYTSVGEDPYKLLPPTYLVEPRNKEDASTWPGWKEFEAHFQRCARQEGCRNLWLIKPTSLNRGIGIEVMRDLDEMKAFLAVKARQASMGIQPVWVLQKYIENPLLFAGRKFDFRVWVLVTDSGDVYMHTPGYIRTSSEVFDLASDDRFAHLTNYCQQVNASSFGKFEDGNTLKFCDLEEYLTVNTLPALRAKVASGASVSVTLPVAVSDGTGPSAESDALSATASALPSSTSRKEALATGARGKGKRDSTSPEDKPLHLAADGEEAVWGCGKHGLWAQMRAGVIDCFEALRGRGGGRTQGYEENGFARKPPMHIVLPPKPDAKMDAKEAVGEIEGVVEAGSGSGTKSAPSSTNGYPCGAAASVPGPSGSRHRFELLGLDFIADDNLQIYL